MSSPNNDCERGESEKGKPDDKSRPKHRYADIDLVNATLSALGSRPNQIREIRGMDHDGLLRRDSTAQQGKGAR